MKKVIPELFLKKATESKDKTAFNYFKDEWKTITYEKLLGNVKSIAAYLITAGIKKGDRIAIYLPNSPSAC